uniref:Putative membrane protein n=1 Tax=Streptomyces ambofaciens (strain ATCC 23877 / 3486 / DSM 40053 / JCM 4204 / NBRC 12836 / NRRL B-2516) TaxID=278992 RepID=A3KKY8_STRA7|nr:putative membrane protein [Streptomyces ambofaciens ATCC 23877]
MTNVSAAHAAHGGKVDRATSGIALDGRRGESTELRDQRVAMTAHTATATRVRTGGPKDDGPKVLEHVMGWTLVVVLAMLVVQLGLL